jgi:hypothetical protein
MIDYLYSNNSIIKNKEETIATYIPILYIIPNNNNIFFDKIHFYQIVFKKTIDKYLRAKIFRNNINPISEKDDFYQQIN